MEYDYASLVTQSWLKPSSLRPCDHMEGVSHKLCRLKETVKIWEWNKKCYRKQLLLDINTEISALLQLDFGLLSATDTDKLRALKSKKENLIIHEVITLRLKSRALWISEGDANTKNFHAFASARRNTKTIWSLKDNDGNLISEDIPLK